MNPDKPGRVTSPDEPQAQMSPNGPVQAWTSLDESGQAQTNPDEP